MSSDSNQDIVFMEGPAGPPGPKGDKGDVGLPGDSVYLPPSSDLPAKGKFVSVSGFFPTSATVVVKMSCTFLLYNVSTVLSYLILSYLIYVKTCNIARVQFVIFVCKKMLFTRIHFFTCTK